MGPGFSNREANVNPTVVDQGKAVATATTDDAAHAAHEVYEAICAVTRLSPRPELPAQLTVAWADRTYVFFTGDSGPNA
jgi:hypothetical protein